MICGYSADTIRQVEKPYISAPDYNGWLMGKAAEGLANYCLGYLYQHGISPAKIMILAGKGNNGADALFAGVHLLQRGHSVVAYLPQGNNSSTALYEFQRAGGQLIDLQGVSSLLPITNMVVDGLLGIGAQGNPREEIRAVIDIVNQAKRHTAFYTVACDVPSGLSAESDINYDRVMHADSTVTFIAAKDSLLFAPNSVVGALNVVPLGIEQDLAKYTPTICQWDDTELTQFFPQPLPTDHKYSRGVCGIVAGSPEYPGAAILATSAAARTGCGMAKFFGPESLRFHIAGQVPEAVTSSESTDGAVVSAWLLGPGAVGDERRADIVHALASGRPALIDAAALEPTAQWVVDQGKLTPAHLLTPHVGELVRLLTWLYALAPEKWEEETGLGEPSKEAIGKDPLAWTKLAARITGATVMLKGNTAWISTPDGQSFSYRARTSWLATAGSGDTLSGIIASILAQYTARWEATGHQPQTSEYAKIIALGVHIHNLSALAANRGLPGPVPPSYLGQSIPLAIAQMLNS